MNDKTIHLKLGIGAFATAAFLLLIAIPVWVSSPSNVPNIVLEPTFWPNTLAALTGLTGAGLFLSSLRQTKSKDPELSDVEDRRAAFLRLAMLAGIMVGTLFAMPRLGLVWTAMLVFASLAVLVCASHPKTALICAVFVPLAFICFLHMSRVLPFPKAFL